MRPKFSVVHPLLHPLCIHLRLQMFLCLGQIRGGQDIYMSIELHVHYQFSIVFTIMYTHYALRFTVSCSVLISVPQVYVLYLKRIY